jgi:integrative and conjugative element protein (TIGR02256 family)
MNLPQVAWLSRSVLTFLTEEADRAAPDETGGILLGYWTGQHGDPVITHAIGPGPGAIHERERFVPDHEFQTLQIARLYEASGRRLQYLGDWHTHPGADAYLSGKDEATLKQIAMHRDARAPKPVMLILAGGPEWLPSAWVAALTSRRLWRRRLITRLVQIKVFEMQAKQR